MAERHRFDKMMISHVDVEHDKGVQEILKPFYGHPDLRDHDRGLLPLSRAF